MRSIHVSCLTASQAPVIGVVVRMPPPSRWSCVLRWDVRSHVVEEGAWTTLRLKQRVCRLSPDGEFLLYNAGGPLKGPFSRESGGAVAISRLPWLAALTDIRPASIMGGGPSRHALSRGEQDELWRRFKDAPWHYMERNWRAHLGHRWQRLNSTGGYGPEAIPWLGDRRARRVATAVVPKKNLRLVAVSDRRRLNDSTNDTLRFFLESGEGDSRRLREIDGVTWAHPTDEGGIAVATFTGHLQHLRPGSEGSATAKLRIDQDHNLCKLRRRAGPAPRWAMAPLGARRSR